VFDKHSDSPTIQPFSGHLGRFRGYLVEFDSCPTSVQCPHFPYLSNGHLMFKPAPLPDRQRHKIDKMDKDCTLYFFFFSGMRGLLVYANYALSSIEFSIVPSTAPNPSYLLMSGAAASETGVLYIRLDIRLPTSSVLSLASGRRDRPSLVLRTPHGSSIHEKLRKRSGSFL
jgi:hypothetical protein